MVVTDIRDFIAAGQLAAANNSSRRSGLRPYFWYLEPLQRRASSVGVTPGSSCIANAYSNNHDVIASKDTGVLKGLARFTRWMRWGCARHHLLRIQALLLLFKVLVFSGHRHPRPAATGRRGAGAGARRADNRCRAGVGEEKHRADHDEAALDPDVAPHDHAHGHRREDGRQGDCW